MAFAMERAYEIQDHLAKGEAYFEQKQWSDAVEEDTIVIEIDPQNVLAYYNRSGAYEKEAAYDQSIADLTTVIELDPKNAEAYYWRGWDYDLSNLTYHFKEVRNQAIADYTKAIELDPNYAEAYYSRAADYCANGDWNQGRIDFNKAGN